MLSLNNIYRTIYFIWISSCYRAFNLRLISVFTSFSPQLLSRLDGFFSSLKSTMFKTNTTITDITIIIHLYYLLIYIYIKSIFYK